MYMHILKSVFINYHCSSAELSCSRPGIHRISVQGVPICIHGMDSFDREFLYCSSAELFRPGNPQHNSRLNIILWLFSLSTKLYSLLLQVVNCIVLCVNTGSWAWSCQQQQPVYFHSMFYTSLHVYFPHMDYVIQRQICNSMADRYQHNTE